MTKSTCSADATGLSDRRRFLSTLASASALGLTTLPALAEAPGPIEALYAEHLRIETMCNTAAIAVMDAEEHYEEPPRPIWHPFYEEGGYKIIPTGDRNSITAPDDGDENIAYLKDLIAKESEPDDPNVGYRNAIRARGARKTLGKIEVWQAEVRRRKDKAGLTKLEEAEDRAWTASAANCDAIFALEATTFRELACQAAILAVDWDQLRAENVFERLVELAGVMPLANA